MNTKRCRDLALSILAATGLLAVLASTALAAVPAARNLGSRGRRNAGEPATPAQAGTRIVGGSPTTASQFPWQAQLEIETDEGTFLCGGTLIHPYIVLTAAHCLTDDEGEFSSGIEVTAWLGRTLLDSGGIPDEGFDLWVPFAYDPETLEWDLGFVVLSQPSGLPRLEIAGPTERALWTAGRLETISGWGTTSEGGSLSPVLQQAQVPIVDDGICSRSDINGALGFSATTMVCAAPLGGGTDTCQGDSGGPLQAPIDGGGYRLVGITSWGLGCAEPNKPGVYTRVASDPVQSLATSIIAQIETEDGLPPTGVNVIGSGALPAGCAVADAQLGVATGAAAGANATVVAGEGELRTARKAVKSANVSFRSALRSKRHRLPGSPARLRRAKRKLRTAHRRLKSTRAAVGTAKANAAAAGAAATAAAANRVAVCG